MYFFIFRLLIHTTTIALTIAVLPGLSIENSTLFDYLVLGGIFGVLNAFVRPFFIFLTGRLVIRTMGLFMIVINSMVLVLLALIWPNWHFDNIITVIMAGLVIGLIGALLDALLGLNRPIIDEIENDESYWRFISRIDSGRRSTIVENLRFEQVYDTFWRYGLEIFLGRTPLAPLRQYIGKLFYPNSNTIEDLSAPAQVRIMLQELGPTYVKLGQIVSSQSRAIPPDWLDELSKLQSDVAPFPGSEAVKIVEDEIGNSIDEAFAAFEEEPFAAASTAQVHKATLFDRTQVVVKVQRPLIVPKVKADVGIIAEAIKTAERRFEWARDSDLHSIFDEFATNVVAELDYRNEAYYAVRLQQNMATMDGIRVPAIYPQLSSERVLTMDFVKGVKITDIDALDAAGLDRPTLARNFLRAMIKQVMIDGFMHGDPHPGNVMVNLETGDIYFIDMGMMGHLERDQRLALIDLLWAIRTQDAYELASVFIKLSVPFKPFDEKKFRSRVDRVVDRYMTYAEDNNSFAGIVNAALDVLYESGLRLDGDLTIALKALIQAEEIVSALDPQPLVIEIAFATVRESLLEQLNVDNVTEIAKTQAVRTAREVVRRMPTLQEATLRWLDQYEKGKFSVTIETDQLAKEVDRITGAVQQLAIGFVLLGIIVGAGIATQVEGTFLGLELSSVGFFLFVAALGLGVYYLFKMISNLPKNNR